MQRNLSVPPAEHLWEGSQPKERTQIALASEVVRVEMMFQDLMLGKPHLG